MSKAPDWVQSIQGQIRQADDKILAGDKTVTQKMVDMFDEDTKNMILSQRPKKLSRRSQHKTRVSEKMREQMVDIIKSEKS